MSQEANEQGPGAHRYLPEVSVSQVHLTIIAYYVGIQWTNKVFIIHSTILDGPEESRPTLTDAVNFHVIVTGIAPATAMPTQHFAYLGRSLHFMQLSTAPKAGGFNLMSSSQQHYQHSTPSIDLTRTHCCCATHSSIILLWRRPHLKTSTHLLINFSSALSAQMHSEGCALAYDQATTACSLHQVLLFCLPWSSLANVEHILNCSGTKS